MDSDTKIGIFFLASVSAFLSGFLFGYKLLPAYHSYYKNKEHTNNNDDDEVVEEEEVNRYTDNVWRVLVDDMLGGEIMERLSLFDQARFRAVCKDWLAIHSNYKTKIKSLPWYVAYDCQLPVVSNKLEFTLYDPLSTPNLVSTQYVSLTPLGIPPPLSHKNIGATLKNNWLLISIGRPKFFSKMRRYFLAYSPFTKQLIKLPVFDYPSGDVFRKTFTTVPDSPGCVFFLSKYPIVDKFVFVTCRVGESEWTIKEFGRVDAFVPCHCNLVFIRGIMYIVSPYGQIASYNIVDGEFRYENLDRDEIFTLNYNSSCDYRVFELNGELMMLYFCSRKKRYNTSPGKHCLKQFDWSNMVWIPVTTLGDATLIVGHNIFSLAIISREEMGYNRILSNKIYVFFDGGCNIYNVENGDFVLFKSIDLKSVKDVSGDLPEYKYNGVTSTETKLYSYLKPPEGRR